MAPVVHSIANGVMVSDNVAHGVRLLAIITGAI
jgi:hypothetical protein